MGEEVLLTCINTQWQGAKSEADCYLWYPEPGPRGIEHKLKHKKFHWNGTNLFIFFFFLNCQSGWILEQVSQRGCRVSKPQRYSKANWTWLQATCSSWPHVEQGELDDLQGSPRGWAILWFYNSTPSNSMILQNNLLHFHYPCLQVIIPVRYFSASYWCLSSLASFKNTSYHLIHKFFTHH